MVVIIDGPADGAEGIVTAGQDIGKRKLLHPGGSCRLDNAHVGDIMAHHGIKFDLQILHVFSVVVLFENPISNGPFFRFVPVRLQISCRKQLLRLLLLYNLVSVDKKNTAFV